MNKILKKVTISSGETDIKEYVVHCPDIAKKHEAGQFVIIRATENGERIPLTIADSSRENGTINLVVQEVGKSTIQMGTLNVGDAFLDVAGPLGTPTNVEKVGTVVCVGGGVGVAPVFPIAKSMKKNGNKVISILGARSKDILIYEEEIKGVSDEVIITTDDGSYGKKGFVTNALEELVKKGEKIDLVVTAGPPIMMKMICFLTKKYDIKTFASLNTIMLDGTGMCGGCRVTVGGVAKFVCVDGPEFDGHLVDFDEMINRLSYYADEEKKAMEFCEKKTCHTI